MAVCFFAFHRKGGYEYGLLLRATFEEEGARLPPNVTEERKYPIMMNSKYVGAQTPGWGVAREVLLMTPGDR